MKNRSRMIVFTAMFAVINFIAFTYGKITIPIGTGTSTAIHIANAFVVLSGWFLGPVYGGLSGAIGLTIADILDPVYITSAPKTFILKFFIGFIAGQVARTLGLKYMTERSDIIRIASISAMAALGFNVVFDPIIGYLYRNYILGIPQQAAKIIATWVAGSTAVNAIICVFVSVILYLALYKSFLPRLPE